MRLYFEDGSLIYDRLKRTLVLSVLVGIIYGAGMYALAGGPFGGIAASIAMAVFAALAASLAPNFGIACVHSAAAGVFGALLLLASAYVLAPPADQRLIGVFVYAIWASSGGFYGLLAGMLARATLELAVRRAT